MRSDGIALLQFDDAAVFGILFSDEAAHLGHGSVGVAGVARRESEVEQDVGVAAAGDDAQIVDGKLGVQLAEVLRQPGAQHPHGGVRGHDGVIVDGDLQIVFFQKIPLDVVDDVVSGQWVGLGGELDVERSKLVAGAVVVDHQVMHAQYAGVGHDGLLDVRHQLRRGRFAQQGAEGIHDEAPARPEDERSHCHAHDAVDDVPARNAAEDGGEQDSTGVLLELILPVLRKPEKKAMKTIDKSTVKEFNLQRYLGKWYEIARYDHRFERGLHYVTAEYSKRPDGKIKVLNCGHQDAVDGKEKCSIGKARPSHNGQPGQLQVAFFLSFYSDYNILELDPDYQWSLIGSSTDKYLWILSRTPHLDQNTLNQILEKARQRGYDTSRLIFPQQPES